MKKKILSLTLVVCLLAIAVVGGTLAYFVDKESKDNVFTIGNVDITLNEVFDEEDAELMPGKVNAVNKDVTVTNSGEFAIQVGDITNAHFENISFENCAADGIHIGGNSRNN